MRTVVEGERDVAGVAHPGERVGAQARQEQRGRGGMRRERTRHRLLDENDMERAAAETLASLAARVAPTTISSRSTAGG